MLEKINGQIKTHSESVTQFECKNQYLCDTKYIEANSY